jgi:cytochrome P450 family 6
MFLVIIAFVLSLIVLYQAVVKQYSHWDGKEFPHLMAKFPWGNLQSHVKTQRSFATAIFDFYQQTKEPFLGIYLFFRPAVLIKDPEIVKNVLSKDFQYFHDRGIYCDPERDPMSANLFALSGDSWKSLRAKITPVFTLGKIKGMFPHVLHTSDHLVDILHPLALKGESIDLRDFVSRFSLDCFASILFAQRGVSTLDNPKHEFRVKALVANDSSYLSFVIVRSASFVCPQ